MFYMSRRPAIYRGRFEKITREWGPLRSFRYVFIISFLLYALIGSYLVYKYQHTPGEDIFDVQFCFGPIIKSIVGGELLTGTGGRMLLIPYLLSAIAAVWKMSAVFSMWG